LRHQQHRRQQQQQQQQQQQRLGGERRAPEASGRRIVPDRYKLFVGSLAWTTTEDTLRPLFSEFGECQCRVVFERDEPTKSR
jgi:RNA recognition motif-containing protein